MAKKTAKPSRKLPRRFKPAQVIAALEASGGIISNAARMLKCVRQTVTNYVNRFPEVRAALEEILEQRIDVAETVILKRMSDDKFPAQQVTAASFYLRFKGKGRGYVEGSRSVVIELPQLNSIANVLHANRVVLEQCAAGVITPAEAKAFADLLDMRVRAIAQVEHEERFRAIEQHLQQLGLSSARH